MHLKVWFYIIKVLSNHFLINGNLELSANNIGLLILKVTNDIDSCSFHIQQGHKTHQQYTLL